jgi:hypothetical protein
VEIDASVRAASSGVVSRASIASYTPRYARRVRLSRLALDVNIRTISALEEVRRMGVDCNHLSCVLYLQHTLASDLAPLQ